MPIDKRDGDYALMDEAQEIATGINCGLEQAGA
jgi:hypothetical protein